MSKMNEAPESGAFVFVAGAFVAGAVSWLRTSATGVSGHRRHVSQVIGDSAVGLDAQRCRNLSLSSPHCSWSTSRRPRSLPALRGSPGLGLQAHGPLRAEGEAALTPRSRRAEVVPDRHTGGHGGAGAAAAQAAGRGRSGRRRRHDRLAPDPPPPHDAVAGDDQPDPGPGRRGRPGTGQAAQVLLHPLRSRACRTSAGSPTSPTTGSPASTDTRRRRRDPDLAR